MRNFDKRGERSPQYPKFSIGIDLGSNTLRAVKRDCEKGVFVAEYERIVRTADGLTETGRIAPKALERIVAALDEARKQIGFDGAVLRAVTTEAMRRAENAVEVLKTIQEKTGVAFEIIEADEEARLTLMAVRYRLRVLNEPEDSFVLVDIGGGSTELIIVVGGRTLSRSFPLGIVTLSQEAQGDLARVESLLEIRLKPLEKFVMEAVEVAGRPKRFIATAGTPTTIAAMKHGMNYHSYDAGRINGTRLERRELREWLAKLLAMSPRERERTVGVGRDDLIAAGILIFEGIFRVLGFEECLVIDDGLREGVALELCRG